MRLSREFKELESALSAWTPNAAPAATWLLPELRELFDASFVGAYQPVATDHGWDLDFMHGAGPTAPLHIRWFRQWVIDLPPSDRFVGYQPHRVDTSQRNKVVQLKDVPRSVSAEFAESLYRAVGLPGHDQLRVLVCDGPRLMCWLGATRAEPFAPREAAALRRLTGALQRRLRLERQLRPSWATPAALEAALEAVTRPAFVLGPRDTIALANRSGLVLLARDAKGVVAAIRQSERHASTGAFTVTKVSAPGWPPYLLAIAKEPEPGVSTLVSLAQEAWGLTARQATILELLVGGATNKEIAMQSSCAEVTVENHVTELYRRSGSRSRTDLVRRVFLLRRS